MPGRLNGANNIKRAIKSFFIRFLLNLIKGFKFIIKSFFNLLKPLFKLLKWLAVFFYKYIFLNLYKLSYYFKELFNHVFPAEKKQLVYLFVNKYITHFVVIILTFAICFTNIFTTQTKAEGFGEKSVLYALTTGSDLESQYVEETLRDNQPGVASYQKSQGAAVSAPSQVSPEDNLLSQEETNMLISGEGSAVIKPEFSSIEASKIQRDQPIEYVVKEGDSLGLIAANFGISIDTVLWENNLTSQSLIRPGQSLVILPTNGIKHKIVKGETLAQIAKKYKSDKEKIIEFNKLASENDIQVGQILIIPEGQPYYAPPVSRPRLAPIQQIFSEVDTGASEGKMLWPNGCRRITQYFSWRHTGVDIACEAGTPIRAADDGTVILVKYLNTGYGHQVDIDHGGGKMTRYGHMTEIYVKPGQTIQRGQIIGLEGSTGHSTGPHLHFEVRFFGKVYNPLSYIR